MRDINSQRGRSMVEMMGYVAVVMTLVSAMGMMVSKVYGEFKMSKASIQLSDLAGSISKAATIDADYQEVVAMVNGNVSSETKKREGRRIIPSSYRVSGGKIYHVFGGEVKIGVPNSDENPTEKSDKFSIQFEGLNREQCIELAMKDWQNNKVVDLYAIMINVNNRWYWPVYTSDVDNELPVTRSAVAGATADDKGQCSKDTGNVIMWVFN